MIPFQDLNTHVIDVIEGTTPGPVSVWMGGIHGNEPSGILAITSVMEWLRKHNAPLRGRIIGSRGNPDTLSAGVRHLDLDLNRVFPLPYLYGGDLDLPGKDSRRRNAVIDILQQWLASIGNENGGYFFDLHSFSSHGPPFSIITDTLRNSALARQMNIPVVRNFNENLNGTLTDYVTHAGATAMTIEAGNHDDTETVTRHEQLMRMALVAIGHLYPQDVPSYADDCASIAASVQGVPQNLELVDRHPIHEESSFSMHPGLRNLAPVSCGDAIATDADGPVYVGHKRCLVLMPLYQEQGREGFFLVRARPAFLVELSSFLRRTGLGNILRLLSTWRSGKMGFVLPENAGIRIAILKLAGYRKRTTIEGVTEYVRPRYDSRAPSSPDFMD